MNSYLNFLKLSEIINSKFSGMEIDSTAVKLLEMIAVSYSSEKALNVTEAMHLSSIGSQATLHRKINDLREHGLISLVHEGKNRRTKYLVPSAKANKHFDQLSKVMGKALQTATT
jgi:DNA-binding transcriptional ArsR family regulator